MASDRHRQARRIFAGCVLCGLGLLYSSQAGPAAKEAERVAALPEERGGTPEDRLWEVLLLAGVGEDKPANWDGHFTISGGEMSWALFDGNGRMMLPER